MARSRPPLPSEHITSPHAAFDKPAVGQIVLVFQGGGALGAYQGGVYQALHEARVEPDWVIGTSIGAINASLIVGNSFEERLPRLREFWRRVTQPVLTQMFAHTPGFGAAAANAMTVARGLENFFTPNPWAFLGGQVPLGPDLAGYYSTKPLEKTLEDLVDLERLNHGAIRLSVGAAKVQTGEMRYFDSREAPLTIRHILASGALPPAFPAIRIDGDLYWDGGILSNTPVEAVFDDNPRRNGLVFAVHLWRPHGPEPDSIDKVLARQKDLLYSSRAVSHIARQKQIHKLRHVISELTRNLPEEVRARPDVRELASYGCVTRMHVVRMCAPNLNDQGQSKDIDFSPEGIKYRWEAGYRDMLAVIDKAPWTHQFDPLEGFILHEAEHGEIVKEG